MITRNHIKKLTAQLNIPAFGIAQWPLPESARDFIHTDNPCPFINGTLEERLTGNTAIDAKSAIVCLFPYYVPPDKLQPHNAAFIKDPHIASGETDSDDIASGVIIPNLPKYAWAHDYHLVVRDYLMRLGESLRALQPDVEFEVHCDTSPLADRYMAYLAGLGVFGKNRALINPTWGSYTNIGTLLTNLELPVDSPMEGTCLSCNRCVKSCPGQSLGSKEFRYETCKSYLTQKKGELPDAEGSIIQKSPLVWGCDICQDVCPHNRNVPLTPIKEFQHIDPRIEPNLLGPMTNRQFKEAFGHRAFAWRGKATLWRNCQLLAAKAKEKSDISDSEE